LLPWFLLAALIGGCFGPRAELRRRGIAVDSDQLVAHATSGDAEVVGLLLRAKVPVDGRDAYGTTPLMAAAQSGHAGLVGLLLEQGADPSLGPVAPGPGPLASAAMGGHVEVVRALLAVGVAVDSQDRLQGTTPLMLASAEGHTGVVGMLLEAGADVRVLDETGWTALHHAVRGGHLAVARRLLAAGAEPLAEDREGWSPLDLSKSAGEWEVVAALEEQVDESARRRRLSRLGDSPLAVPSGWELFDRLDGQARFWPEYAAFSANYDPPGSRRLLLRSPPGEAAQIFLILGRAATWWDHFRHRVQEIEGDPELETRQIQMVTSKDGVGFELRRYRLGQDQDDTRSTERVLALAEAQGSWVVVVDAGGSAQAIGVERITSVIEDSRLLEALGLSEPS
jgi:hypothetical protein